MKVLLVCESFSNKKSGGKVVRYIHKILSTYGHEVRVAITSQFNEVDTWTEAASDFINRIPSQTRHYQRLLFLANKSLVPREFSHLVDSFEPDVVHFASFDHTKSSNLYTYCKNRGIRIVLQPWTMHFFCAQGFGFLEGRQCTACISDGFGTAIQAGCLSYIGSLRQLERVELQRMAVGSADIVLSSNSDLDKILVNYGISEHRIRRFPIAFDTSQVSVLDDLETENYFINYGQANDHKGTRFLIDLFTLMPDKHLHLYPMDDYLPHKTLPPNIQIFRGIGWNTGLSEAIVKAKAVVQPSLWATSTEYALCEAMAMGKPVIAFKVGVHKDILTHGKNAMVINVGDIEHFKAAVNTLDTDPQLRAKLSADGIISIAEINNPEKLHLQLIDAYSAK